MPLADAGAVRYVGFTSQHLFARLSNHVCRARGGERSHKGDWLRKLLRMGLRPMVVVLETGTDMAAWPGAERRWIAHHRALGANLTNATDGGEGTLGAIQPREAVARVAAINRVRRSTPEARAAVSAQFKAYWHGRKPTLEQCARFAAARTAYHAEKRAPLLAEVERLGVINVYETAKRTGKTYKSIVSMCFRLTSIGLLRRVKRGYYTIANPRSALPIRTLPARGQLDLFSRY
jgi:hypothetical protein